MPAAGGRGEEEARVQQESTDGTLQNDRLKSSAVCLHDAKIDMIYSVLFTLHTLLQYSRCVIALASVATVLLAAMALYNLMTPRASSSHPSPSSSLPLPQAESCTDPCK